MFLFSFDTFTYLIRNQSTAKLSYMLMPVNYKLIDLETIIVMGS